MSYTHHTITRYLISRRLASQLQLDEARELSRKNGLSLEDALVRLGHVKVADLVGALFEALNLPFGGLDHVTIPPDVVDLVPASLARERMILPLGSFGNHLFVAMTAPFDDDALQALQFILNKDIWPVPVPREQIRQAIDRYYDVADQESVDSPLCEFTDTAIDFTETKDIFETDFALPALEGEVSDVQIPAEDHDSLESSDSDLESSDFDLGMSGGSSDELLLENSADNEVAPTARRQPQGASLAKVTRHATVRYYYRMNPGRLFPLLVVISKRAIEKAVKKHVAQQQGGPFQVAVDSVVEVEPILPGCNCYPPREQVVIGREEASAKFYVVPHVFGRLLHARVVVRQDGRVLAEVPLEIRVVKQGLTVLMGGLNVALPFGLMVLKHFHLDFESQLANGFDLYAGTIQWALRSLSPGGLAGLLLLLTATSFLWFRPRQRDVFWDICPIGPEPPPDSCEPSGPPKLSDEARNIQPESPTDRQEALFAKAEQCYLRTDYAGALRLYESGLVLGPAPAIIYHHASLAAGEMGNPGRALTILEGAVARLPRNQMQGALWFNMGCFAVRLGRLADAVRYLHRAVDAGFTTLDKYLGDPDLCPLRWRGDFKRLLHFLENLAVDKKG